MKRLGALAALLVALTACNPLTFHGSSNAGDPCAITKTHQHPAAWCYPAPPAWIVNNSPVPYPNPPGWPS